MIKFRLHQNDHICTVYLIGTSYDRPLFDIEFSYSTNPDHKLDALNIANGMVAALNAEAINAEQERSTANEA